MRELLFTLGIIVLLTIVFFWSATSCPIPSGRAQAQAQAQAQAENIRTAIMSYFTEYGHFPLPTNTGTMDVYYSSTNARAWGNLIVALCGGIDPATGEKPGREWLRVPNPRGIVFISLNKRDLDTRAGVGIPKLPYPDANGNPQYFCVAMDDNADGLLGDRDQAAGMLPDIDHGKLGGALVKEKVAVWGNCNDPRTNSMNVNLWVRTY